jgi:predicted GNAT family acetyltransferase
MLEHVQAVLRSLDVTGGTTASLMRADDGAESFSIQKNDEEIGRFRMKELPGCSGAVVFCRAWVPSAFRGRGFGKMMHKVRIEAARRAGYSLAICTVVVTNASQIAILTEFGWRLARQWRNPKTGNDVGLWTRGL